MTPNAIDAAFEHARQRRAAAFRKLDAGDEPSKLQERAHKLADALDGLADALAADDDDVQNRADTVLAELLELAGVLRVAELPDGGCSPRVGGALLAKLTSAIRVAAHLAVHGPERLNAEGDPEAVALPPNHPRTPDDIDRLTSAVEGISDKRALWYAKFRPADVRALLACSDETVRLAAEALGLARPGRGQRGFAYTPEELTRLARHFAEHGDGGLRGKATALLDALTYTYGL